MRQPALKFASKPKAKRDYPETRLQAAVVQFLLLSSYPNVLWYSIPNGAKLAKRTAVHMKRTGMTAGAADLAIIVSGHCYFLELKAGKAGVQSDAQKEFQHRAYNAGAAYSIATSLDQALSLLRAWGAIKPERRAA